MSDIPDRDLLRPLAPVPLGDSTVYVDEGRPVAAIVAPGGGTTFATWPDAPLPPQVGGIETFTSPNAVWVVYSRPEQGGHEGARQPATAVRIAADGGTASFGLGALYPIGADDEGIWLTSQPEPTVDFESGDLDDADQEAVDDVDGPPDMTGAPLEEWEDVHSGRPSIDDVTNFGPESGSEDAETADGAEGAEGSGMWVALYDLDPDDRNPPMKPLAPTPPEPVTISRRSPDGSEVRVHVDHVVQSVEALPKAAATDARLRLTVNLSGPIGTPERFGGMSFAYPMGFADIDVSSGIPSEVVLGPADLTSIPLEADEWDDDEYLRDQEAIAHAPRIDLATVPGSRWTRKPLPPRQIDATVNGITRILRGLGDPDTIWTRSDDAWHLVRSSYRELRVVVSGQGSESVVTATFRYADEGDRLFRFRVLAFDESGRPRDTRYLTVGLMEDIETLDTEQAPVSDDGFIDIEPKFSW